MAPTWARAGQEAKAWQQAGGSADRPWACSSRPCTTALGTCPGRTCSPPWSATPSACRCRSGRPFSTSSPTPPPRRPLRWRPRRRTCWPGSTRSRPGSPPGSMPMTRATAGTATAGPTRRPRPGPWTPTRCSPRSARCSWRATCRPRERHTNGCWRRSASAGAMAGRWSCGSWSRPRCPRRWPGTCAASLRPPRPMPAPPRCTAPG